MPDAAPDHQARALTFIGKRVEFDAPPPAKKGLRFTGSVTAARFSGLTTKGQIPDFELTIQGKTGRTVVISMVETYASFL